MAPRRVTVVSFSPIHRDARVLRHVRRLARTHEVTVVGYGDLGSGADGLVRMKRIREPAGFVRRNLRAIPELIYGRLDPARGYDSWFWGRADHREARQAMLDTPADLVLANDWDSLPIAVAAADKWGSKIVLDLHEYSPAQWDNRRIWMQLIAPMIDHFLRRYQHRVSAFITVGETIANRYAREYGFRPAVVRNIPEVSGNRSVRTTDPLRIRLVHHGAAVSERRLDNMIRAIGLADARVSLDFILVPSNRRHERELRSLAARVAPGRVNFKPAIPPDQIQDVIAEYDMGFYILPPTSYNCHAALPNKFFDFLGAGLAICIGPSPEMARLVEEYGLGVITDGFDPENVGRCLDAVSAPQIDSWKANSLAAREALNAESEGDKLVAAIDQALAH